VREIILGKVAEKLQLKGFEVSSFVHSNTCFDLAARKNRLTLLIKVFDNVDALREEHALELKKLVKLFNAVAMVVGGKTKAFSLKRGVIYERYSLPVVSVESFADILDERMPSVKSFKGREIVELNSEKLRSQRKKLGFTLEELASRINSSIESVHRYEKGHSASLQAAEKLEKVLGESLVKKINFFEAQKPVGKEVFAEDIEDRALRKVHDLGVDLALFRHAPFQAGSEPAQHLVISKSATKQDLKRKAVELQKTRIALDAKGMIIASKTKVKAVGHVPIVEEEELSTMDKFKDLMQLLKEREMEE